MRLLIDHVEARATGCQKPIHLMQRCPDIGSHVIQWDCTWCSERLLPSADLEVDVTVRRGNVKPNQYLQERGMVEYCLNAEFSLEYEC
jgi:hypothetical protein